MRFFLFLAIFFASTAGHAQEWLLYLVAWRGDQTTDWLQNAIVEAVEGGVTVVQLDERELTEAEYVQFGTELHKRLEPFGVPLIINSRVDIAQAIGAEGVHFMKIDEEEINKARERLGPDAILGVSADSLEEITEDYDVTYYSLGPVFPSKTHPEIVPLGLDGIREARRLTQKALIGVGGIRKSNAAEVISAGADGIVVVSAILGADDPKEAASELRTIVEEAR